MTALKWITNEAKKLRRQYPKRFKTWREYVAQASAIYASKHGGKSPVGKKRKAVRRRKKVGATKFIEKGESRRTKPKVYRRVRDKKGHFKSIRIGNVSTKSKTHTDKNRITANIQVGSVESSLAARLKAAVEGRTRIISIYNYWEDYLLTGGKDKVHARKMMKNADRLIRHLDKEIALLKRAIK